MTAIHTIQVGDEVMWVQTSQKGRTVSMRQRAGIVQSVDGDTATVKPPGRGKTVMINLSRLQKKGTGPTELTQLVEAIAVAHRQAAG
jgi:plastocyanin